MGSANMWLLFQALLLLLLFCRQQKRKKGKRNADGLAFPLAPSSDENAPRISALTLDEHEAYIELQQKFSRVQVGSVSSIPSNLLSSSSYFVPPILFHTSSLLLFHTSSLQHATALEAAQFNALHSRVVNEQIDFQNALYREAVTDHRTRYFRLQPPIARHRF